MNGKNPEVKILITGLTPMLQNRDDVKFNHRPDLDPIRSKSESWEEFEARIWKEKCHWSNDNPRAVIFPTTWVQKMLRASQRQSANPIRPVGSRKASDTMMAHFTGGIFQLNEPLIMRNDKPVFDDDLLPFHKMCSPKKGKVLVIRPMIQLPWTVKLNITIMNDMIRPEHIFSCLAWAGTYDGCGDWRISKGGRFGMFSVSKI